MQSLTETTDVPILRPRWLNITEEPVVCLASHITSDLVIAGLSDGRIRLIQYSTGESKETILAHKMGLIQIQLSSCGKKMATTGEDNFIRIYLIDNFKVTQTHQWKSKNWIEQVLWNKESLIFSSSKSLFHWKEFSQDPELIETWSHSISSLTISQNGNLGVSGYSRFCLYDIETLQIVKDFEWKGQLENLRFSNRDRFAVCSSTDMTIHIWDLKKNKDLAMRGFPQKILDMSFRNDGLYMANCSGVEVMIWDYMDPGPAGKKPQILGPFDKPIQFCKYQSKGKILASFGQDGVILFWRPDLFDDRPLAIAGIRDQAITQALWSEDDKEVITGLSSGYVACYPAPEVVEK